MIISDAEQLSPQWFLDRCAVPSASNFDKIVTSKGAPSKQAEKYMYQLAGEAITGVKTETYSNAAMERGVELEEEARQLYELINGVSVEKVGFVYKDEQKKYGCSPDGLVNSDGLIEIKCPTIPVAVEYLLKGKLPTTYFQQCQGQLFIAERAWVDFFSYYPGLPHLVVRVERDETFINALEEQLEKFVFDLAKVTKKLREME